jgi:hypothetical protein
MLDDIDLRHRFRERSEATTAPGDALFARIIAELDAPPARRRLALPVLRWALPTAAATMIVVVLGVLVNPWPQHPAGVPERIETVKIDRMPTAPPLMAAERSMEEQAVKVNALRTASVSPGGEPPAATQTALAGIGLARTAAVGLDVPGVTPALDAVQRIARTAGGTVTALQDATPDEPGAERSATVTIVVPEAKLDGTVHALSGIGTVRSRSANAEALGASIVDDAARLRNLRSEESDLLRIMHRSGSVADILDVESKLSDVRGDIEQLEGELAGLQHQVATASIDVTLTERRPVAPAVRPPFGDRIAAAWRTSTHASAALGIALLSIAVGAIAFAPYLLVVAAGVALWWWRRRRAD